MFELCLRVGKQSRCIRLGLLLKGLCWLISVGKKPFGGEVEPEHGVQLEHGEKKAFTFLYLASTRSFTPRQFCSLYLHPLTMSVCLDCSCRLESRLDYTCCGSANCLSEARAFFSGTLPR